MHRMRFRGLVDVGRRLRYALKIIRAKASRKANWALTEDKILHRMLYRFRFSIIGETLRELPQDTGPLFHFPQQHPAGVRRDISAIKLRHDFSASQGMKFNRFRFTLCHQKGRLYVGHLELSQTLNATPGGLFWSLA